MRIAPITMDDGHILGSEALKMPTCSQHYVRLDVHAVHVASGTDNMPYERRVPSRSCTDFKNLHARCSLQFN